MTTVRQAMAGAAAVCASVLLLAACTSTSAEEGAGAAADPSPAVSATAEPGTSGGSASANEQGGPAPEVNRTIRVGSQAIGSNRVVAELYARALKDAGFDVALTVPGTVDVFVDAMAKGQVDVLPVYATRFADYLYTSRLNLNGSRPVTTDLDTTVAAANEYGAERGIRVLSASQAADQPRFAVTRDFAEETGITTLSGLAVWSRTNPLRLGGNPTCEFLAFCKPGLEGTYSMRFKEFVPLSADGAVVKNALDNASIELGYFFGTDPTLASPDLVVLEEDIPRPVFNNVTPAVRRAFATPEVVDTLERVSAALTQQALEGLVRRVDVQGQDPGVVAGAWLAEKGISPGLFDGPLPVADVVVPRTVDAAAPTEPPAAASDAPGIRISYAPTFDTEVAARIYAAALTSAGIPVRVLDPREPADLLQALPTGEVNVAPMRLNVVASILSTDARGPLTLPITTRSVPDLVSDTRDLALPRGMAVLPPSQANAGTAFVVSDRYAALTGVRTLSDLARASEAVPITLGAAPECPQLAGCLPLLTRGYGVTVGEFTPLDAGGPLSRSAIDRGEVDVTLLSANDGGIEEFDLRVLKDDRGREPVNPIAPILDQDVVGPDVARVLNRVSAALTTEDLKEMNRRIEYEREEMQSVVQEFLDSRGLRGIPLAEKG